MIKLVLFDLDGVLVDAKELHFEALNDALRVQGEEFVISMDEHLNIFDGRKTVEKLNLLTERKGLPVEKHRDVWEHKQSITIEKFGQLGVNHEAKELFQSLEDAGYKIGVCSNSIRRTVLTALAKTGLMEHCSVVISNEDVHNSKPHPEMYWKAMSIMERLPEETVIIEDSPPGLLAAERSRARYIRVKNVAEVNKENLFTKISNLSFKRIEPEWRNNKMNILIPMAGAGSRFADAGYSFPKPLIDVNGKPMIQVVVENLNMVGNYIFVVQKEHREKFALDNMLKLITEKCGVSCNVIEVDGITEGAACTALLARDLIDNDEPLFFANSDQYCEWTPAEFMYEMQEKDADGGIVTFKASHPKWSFAKVDDNGLVTEVAEKNPISDNATVGYYYWKKGSDFVKYADQMIEKDVRVNNEFYVCPVFNEAIGDGKEIRVSEAKGMWGLGTPEDLEHYLKYKA